MHQSLLLIDGNTIYYGVTIINYDKVACSSEVSWHHACQLSCASYEVVSSTGTADFIRITMWCTLFLKMSLNALIFDVRVKPASPEFFPVRPHPRN